MKRFHFLLLLLMLPTTFTARIQSQSLIEFSCPGRSTGNRLPATAREELLYVDDRGENLVLFRVTNTGIAEAQIPIDGGVVEFLLSPSGDYLAMLIYDGNVNLSIFDISNNTLQNYITPVEINFVVSFMWTDTDTIKIIEAAQNQNPRVITLDIDRAEMIEETINISSFFENDDVRYEHLPEFSPDLNSFALLTPDNFYIATVGGEILYDTGTFDFYNTLSSVAWSPTSQELILFTNEWRFLDLNTQESLTLQIPIGYEFSRPVWSPNSEMIAFLGVRLPLERPNTLRELIVYSRSRNTFTDLCQSGIFSILGQYNEVSWSSDSRWLAYIMETLEGWNLYAIDLDNNTIARIELATSGAVPRLLGWR